jgi:Family of unknown function (DUF5330)
MRLIRTILMLTGVGILMPSPPDDLAAQRAMADHEAVSAIEMLSSAGSAASDVAGFCARQPEFCRTAAFVAQRFEAKAKYSARLIYEWASEASDDPSIPDEQIEADGADQLQTGSVDTALADASPGTGQSTLRLDDLIPAWRGPAPAKKKG